jgi:thiol:disulfide interchange protein DsbA
VVRRVPVAFNASFVPQQKLYYALEGMGKLDAVHAKVFRAIHVELQAGQGRRHLCLGGQAGRGSGQVQGGLQLLHRGQPGAPAAQLQGDTAWRCAAMGVAGRYYTDGTMAGSMETVLQVVDAWWARPARPDAPLIQPCTTKARASGLFHPGGNAWLQWMQDSCPP